MQENSVLIVDDEPIVRESIRDWLKDTGYQVLTAETGEEALEMIERQDFSIMVLDIRLPGKTGITVLKEVKTQRPWIKSVIITAYPSAETTGEAMKLGAVNYLIKPIALDNLERLIQETLSSVGREPTVTTEVEIRPKPSAAEVVEVKKSFVSTLLSKREQAVLALVAQGFTNREIATSLFISEHTVKVHVRNIMEKMHAHTRQQAVALAREKAV